MASDFISDEEMAVLQKHGQAKPLVNAAPDYLSDEEMAALQPSAWDATESALTSGVGAAAKVVAPIGSAVDRFTGAPIRAGIGAAQNGNFGQVIPAIVGQFGQNPELAPTGKEIAQKAGVPNTSLSDVFPGLYSDTGKGLALQRGGMFDPTASGVAGLGIDIAADPTNLIPGVVAAKGAAKLGAEGGKIALGGGFKAASKASEALTGSKALENAGTTAKEVYQATKDTISHLASPKQAPSFAKDLEVAKTNNISPDLLPMTIEYGGHSVPARLERRLREMPSNQAMADKYVEGIKQTSDAVDARIKALGGGEVLDQPTAGALIRQNYVDESKKFFDSQDITYKKLQKYAPGIRMNSEAMAKIDSKLDGIEKYAQGLKKRAITKTDSGQAQQLLNMVNGFRASKGNMKQMTEQMQRLGKTAFGAENVLSDIPPDVAKMRDAYFTVSDGIIETARKDINPEFADELLKNNEASKNFFSDKNVLYNAIGSKKMADENVFKSLVQSGDTRKIEALKNILSPEAVNQLKATYIDSLVKRNDSGMVQFGRLRSSIDANKNVISALFEPKEIQDILEVANLGERFGPMVLSTSGTGGSIAMGHALKEPAKATIGNKILGYMTRQKEAVPALSLKEQAKAGRGPFETRLKALQSIAPSQYTEEDKRKARLKALGR